ncbi:hypothetical protein F5141DRAFT_438298 [Pisolithus sp. B1]|nr:hypothetical protein F5141DRAFT_438298 [Pisolithus sp. B1]
MRRLILTDALSCPRLWRIHLGSRWFPAQTNGRHGCESLLHIRRSLVGTSWRRVSVRVETNARLSTTLDQTNRRSKSIIPSMSINARELEPKTNDCRPKDFYPITWRVIGGGVMMGGERRICDAFVAGRCRDGDDCKFAHETELETDPNGCLRLKCEAEVPAARESVREASRRGMKNTREEPTLNSRRDYSERKRPHDVSTSTTRVPFPTETSQQITPRGRRTEEMNLTAQKLGEANIALEICMVKPLTFTAAHRRTRSMVGPSSLLHAEPNVTSPCFLAEF